MPNKIPARYIVGVTTGSVAIGVMAIAGGYVAPGVEFIVAGSAVAGGATYLRFRPGRTATLVDRHDRHAAKHGGTASRLDVFRTSSRWAMLRRAGVVRPSLRSASWWQKYREPLLSYATEICRVGRQRVHLSREDSSLWVGPPGTGKSAAMAGQIIDAPGGVVVTSTAGDVYELTAPLRERLGPVWVLNPSGLGGIKSTLRWSPLSGCENPATAIRRANDLIPQSGESTSEGERWAAEGRRALAPLLHAAALGKYRLRDVMNWVTQPDNPNHVKAVLAALGPSSMAVEMQQAAVGYFGTNARTRDGVKLPMTAALAWLALPGSAAVGDPTGGSDFTVEQLVDQRGSLYLLGDPDKATAPLLAALTSEVVYQARALAANRAGGRLDPGLTLVLDEVALVCPVPLDKWLAEVRKFSISIHAACQGVAQLRERWGDNGASMILTSATAILVFGGCKDPVDLQLFGDLAGTRAAEDGERVPVISTSMLAGLPNHRVMLVRRGMPVALARTPIAWKRRDVKGAAKAAVRVVRTAEKTAAKAAKQKTRVTEPEPIHEGVRA